MLCSCHAVQRIAWTRTDHRSLRRNSSNTDGASCIAATRNAPSSYNSRFPNLAPKMRTAFSGSACNTGSNSPDGDLMTLRTSALANNCSKASSRFPTSRVTSSFGPAATELRPLLRCMAAPFDRCTAYFGAPFHTHTLGCGQTIVVRLAGTLEAGPGIPRSEYMRRRLMSESGQSRPSRQRQEVHHVRCTANTDRKFNAPVSVASCREPTLARLFDHLISEAGQLVREVWRLRGLDVDHPLPRAIVIKFTIRYATQQQSVGLRTAPVCNEPHRVRKSGGRHVCDRCLRSARSSAGPHLCIGACRVNTACARPELAGAHGQADHPTPAGDRHGHCRPAACGTAGGTLGSASGRGEQTKWRRHPGSHGIPFGTRHPYPPAFVRWDHHNQSADT